MSTISKLPFYILLFYPVIGYLTHIFLGNNPFYVFAVVSLIALFFKFIEQDKFLFPLYLKFYLLYVIVIVFSKYVSNSLSLKFDLHLHHTNIQVFTLIALLLVENSKFDISFKNKSILIMTYLVLSAFGVSIIQYFSSSFFLNPSYGYREEIVGYARRVPSIYTWGGFSYTRGVSICLIAMFGILVYEYRKNRKLTYLLIFCTTGIVFLSQLRAAMLAFLVSLVFLVFNRLSVRNTVLIVGTFIGLYFIIDFLDFNFKYFVEERLMSESATSRITAITSFLAAFPENPYFGTGGLLTERLFDTYGFRAQIHNAHLAIAYYYGIFAFIFHTVFIILLTVKTFKTGRSIGYWPPFTAMIVYILATMTMPTGEFLLPGLIFVLVLNKYYTEKKINLS